MLFLGLIRYEQYYGDLVAYGDFPPFGALRHHLPPAVSVGRQKESAFMGRLGALLRPTCTSYAGYAQWTIKLREAIIS